MELDTIFNQDCLVGLKALPDKSIDLILTDPPYGKKADKGTNGFGAAKNRRYTGGWDSMIPPPELFSEMFRVAKNLIIFGGNYFSSYLPPSNCWIFGDKKGDVPAKHVAELLNRELGWNKNTTYTLIKRCMKKGAIERTEPNFMCHALIPKEKVQETETDELIDKVYDGSADKLFAALLGRKKLSAEQIAKLRQIVETYEE